MGDSANNINDIYENKDNSLLIINEDKSNVDNCKINENDNLEIDILSINYDCLNYLDNYDELEENKIIELLDGLNLENNKNGNEEKKNGFLFY